MLSRWLKRRRRPSVTSQPQEEIIPRPRMHSPNPDDPYVCAYCGLSLQPESKALRTQYGSYLCGRDCLIWYTFSSGTYVIADEVTIPEQT